jgi:pre-mRNA-splicing factor ATP-dependent RNA helicase DHX15/PRP43
LHTSFSI